MRGVVIVCRDKAELQCLWKGQRLFTDSSVGFFWRCRSQRKNIECEGKAEDKVGATVFRLQVELDRIEC